MRTEIERVLELQQSYSWQNTPAMQERGLLIRSTMADWLRQHADQFASDLRVPATHFFPEGRDGTGRKTLVPWVRFGSRAQAPSATEGFYVVYLFDAPGQAVYLSLNQGTTDFDGREFVPKPPNLIAERVATARSVLGEWIAAHAYLTSIELHAARLGEGYERGNIAAIRYSRGAVPDDGTLLSDARSYAVALSRLYEAQTRRPLPGDVPEIALAEAAANEAAGKPARRGGVGFRTSAAEIKLVETYAVKLARAYYEVNGWAVTERGRPFDLELRRGEERLTVEVKGTTSDGSGVVLTEGEVQHHAGDFPNNALVVVRGIILDRSTTPGTCSGGELYEVRPWAISQTRLRPISYRYAVPEATFDGPGFSRDVAE